MTDPESRLARAAVGVLGGTFDPVHLGHLHVVDSVRHSLALPRVLLMPCAVPPHKVHRLTDAVHRVAMLRLAVAGHEGAEVSTLELDRGGVSFTIDTLRALRSGVFAVDPVFILGLDALLELHLWREYATLIEEFDLVVVDRPGSDLDLLRRSLDPEVADRILAFEPDGESSPIAHRHRPGAGGRIYHLPIRPVPISSSEVRALAASGAPIDGLVPPGVARYIQEQGLYQQEATR